MNRSSTGKSSNWKAVWMDDELARFLSGLHMPADRLVQPLPEHQRFIDHYCKARA